MIQTRRAHHRDPTHLTVVWSREDADDTGADGDRRPVTGVHVHPATMDATDRRAGGMFAASPRLHPTEDSCEATMDRTPLFPVVNFRPDTAVMAVPR